MGEPSLALVHEWLAARAGSEQVFEQLAAAFPSASLYALSREPGVHFDFQGRSVTTTFLDTDVLRARRGLTLPLMPIAWKRLSKRQRHDAVISSHHAFAGSNQLARGGIHLCYVHTPARYVWTPDLDGRGSSRLLLPARAALKRIDVRAAARITDIAANSTEVAARIKRFWKREARVIFPPVRTEFFGDNLPATPTRDYVLGVGRWIPYKNLHLVIEAADRAGMPVKIAGRGPDRSAIDASARRARVQVEIIESPTDEALRSLYQNAAALIFPTYEDFGIVPVEAQAAGTPVVALGRGGAQDTVIGGVTGVLANSLRIDALANALKECVKELDACSCMRNATRFSAETFRRTVCAWTEEFDIYP